MLRWRGCTRTIVRKWMWGGNLDCRDRACAARLDGEKCVGDRIWRVCQRRVGELEVGVLRALR
eukprot:5517857-Pleurochrysis_carterae.AAC.1